MKSFNSIIAFFFIALFALTSCQKEDLMADVTTNTPTHLKTERTIPATGIHFVNEEVKTQATLEMIENNVTDRSRYLYQIECGTDTRTTTVNEGSSFDVTHYPDCVDLFGDNFTGNDMVYYLSVENTPDARMTHTIKVTDLEADLDLFLFALDANGRVNECKAVSITVGLEDEEIEVTDLAPGAYLVVVDSYVAGIEGAYNISVACSAVSVNPPSIGIEDITSVEYGAYDVKEGAFKMVEENIWVDIAVNGTATSYIETHRDEWSIYLRNETIGINAQLNLYTMFVETLQDDSDAIHIHEILGFE